MRSRTLLHEAHDHALLLMSLAIAPGLHAQNADLHWSSCRSAKALGGTLTCAITSVQLMGSGDGAFRWTGPNGFASTDQNPVVHEPGTYMLTVTEPLGDMSTSQAEVLVDRTAPRAGASGGALTCKSTTVTLKGGGNGSYAWSGPKGFSSQEATALATDPGTYVLTVTGTNGCTSTARTEVLLDNASPTAHASGGVLTCETNGVRLFGRSDEPITWTGPNGFGSQLPNPMVSAPGLYVLSCIGANGCTGLAGTIVGRDMEAPDIRTEDVELDHGQTPVQLRGESFTAGAKCTWSSANGFSSAEKDPWVTTAGFYTLTVEGPNGCTNAMDAAVTQVHDQGSSAPEALVRDRPSQMDTKKLLVSAQPNPFMDLCKLNFTAPERGQATVTVHDASGRVVAELYNNNVEAGESVEMNLRKEQLGFGLHEYRVVIGQNIARGTLLVQ